MHTLPHAGAVILLFWVALLTGCSDKTTTLTQAQPNMTEQAAHELVKPFYDFLGGDSTPDLVRPSYHDDWKSYYSNTESRNLDETFGFVSGPLAQMVPDLKWEIKEIYLTTNNEIVVRGEATGTPVGDSFMGTPIPGGKRFRFMSIDIHQLRGDKIASTYHVEDWRNAILQVAAN